MTADIIAAAVIFAAILGLAGLMVKHGLDL